MYTLAQRRTRERHGFTPKPCWIAHLRYESGWPMRAAHNRISPHHRAYPCPNDHRRAKLIAVLKELGMLGPIALGEFAT